MRKKLMKNFMIGEYHFDGDLEKKFSIGKLKAVKFEFEDCILIDVKKGKMETFEEGTGEIRFKNNGHIFSIGEIPNKQDLKKIDEIKTKIKMLQELAKGDGKPEK